MKAFIVTIATIILMTNIWLITNDLQQLKRHNEELRYVAEQASVTGSLYLDQRAYGIGYLRFDDDQSVIAIKDIVCSNMRLDDIQMPKQDSYWQDTVVIDVSLFDDESCRVYRNGTLIQEFVFDYPYLYTDLQSGFSQAITQPTVCVTVDAGTRPIGGGLFQLAPSLKRSAAHELVGR